MWCHIDRLTAMVAEISGLSGDFGPLSLPLPLSVSADSDSDSSEWAQSSLKASVAARLLQEGGAILDESPLTLLCDPVAASSPHFRLLDDPTVLRLSLPLDFFRLHSLRMRGWDRPLYCVEAPGSLHHRLQTAAARELRATPERPVAVLTADPAARHLDIYGLHHLDADYLSDPAADPDVVISLQYVPEPRLRPDGFFPFPKAMLATLALRIAASLNS